MSEKIQPVDEKVAVDRAPSLDEKYSVDSHDPNRLMEGSEGVTHHEFETLRHVADRFPVATWMIVVVEFAERSASLVSFVMRSAKAALVGPTTEQ
jgi:proton-dependent oligopeptide transporter, POT family